MRRRAILTILTLGALAPLLAACGSGAGGASGIGASGPSVLSVARAHGLNDFLRAVETAGLTETLSGPGPFTLFVPTDRAFSTAGRPRTEEQAKALVAYHVVPGTFTSEFLSGMDVNYTTLGGQSLNVDGTSGGLKVNNANVTGPDLDASNGVVHVIDRVLTPR